MQIHRRSERLQACFTYPASDHRIVLTADVFSGTEGDIRLVGASVDGNDPAAGVGILEIFHAGAWGTVCNGDPVNGDPVIQDYGSLSFEDYSDFILTVVCFVNAASLFRKVLLVAVVAACSCSILTKCLFPRSDSSDLG